MTLGTSPPRHHHQTIMTIRPISGAKACLARYGRFLVAFLMFTAAVLAACLVLVGPGQAIVVTLGDPIIVHTAPASPVKMPAPIESTIDVDLRLAPPRAACRCGTRDGLRVLIQAYRRLQVPAKVIAFAVPARGAQSADVAANSAQLRRLLVEITPELRSGQPRQHRSGPRSVDAAGEPHCASVWTSRPSRSTAYHPAGRIERLTLPTETLNATVAPCVPSGKPSRPSGRDPGARLDRRSKTARDPVCARRRTLP